ncbi:hypothetical protein LTR36_003967 [Oleoguttula mirabilis]|uniref:BTB domain-containing protein n=1 Tax=Oleoguttula mirabilis TaxID=1507867 RepID=A0AAV9JHN7_9PEZI|nr:hypothetical protein LTR36_003967 [Oleoguttula mirabilis]
MALVTHELGLGLASLFHSSNFSDLTIICGKYTFKVHKVIVCVQSEYFNVACRKGTFKEGESGIIQLKAVDSEGGEDDGSCDDPEIIQLMVAFFYYQGYTGEPMEFKGLERTAVKDAPSPEINLVLHAKVFATAIKYQVPALAAAASEKFERAAERHYNHADFAEAIRIVYGSTPDDVTELRDIVVDTLLQQKGLLQKPEIKSSIESINGLACKLLAKTWQANEFNPVGSTTAPAPYACKYCCNVVRRNVCCATCGSCGNEWIYCGDCQSGLTQFKCWYCRNGVSCVAQKA